MTAIRRPLITTLISLGFLAIVNAQHNVTVNSTSPSITYGGNAKDTPICKYGPGLTVLPGQDGCYEILSQCTEGAAFGIGGTGSAEFSFKGSAIYINSALDVQSPMFTVTLDGQSTDVDGVRNSTSYECYPLFSKTGLDPNVEHQIKLGVKGPSPNRDQLIPNSEQFYAFSLISFVYTAVDDKNGGNTTATGGSKSAGGVSSTAPGQLSGSSANPTTSGAAATSSSPAEMRHVPRLISASAAVLAGLTALGSDVQ